MEKGKHFRQLKYRDRLKIEALVMEKHSVSDIARRLEVTRDTIYKELKIGLYKRLDTQLREYDSYSADIAQREHEYRTSLRGTGLKIDHDHELAAYIENKIIEEGYSPEAVVAYIKNNDLQFDTSICARTIYNYIDGGVFLNLTNKELPVKGQRKRKYRQVRPKERLHHFGKNIEDRPEEVSHRETFGDWEMDTVVGPRGKSKCSLLVLTERKTRQEIVRLLKEHTAAAVVAELDELEHRLGTWFKRIFRTITVDNGTEFSNYDGMIKSALSNDQRTEIFYCHPYSSYERGSNENQNKLIRRHIKKKTNFDDICIDRVKHIEDWINNYPRRMMGFQCSSFLFYEELKRLGFDYALW